MTVWYKHKSEIFVLVFLCSQNISNHKTILMNALINNGILLNLAWPHWPGLASELAWPHFWLQSWLGPKFWPDLNSWSSLKFGLYKFFFFFSHILIFENLIYVQYTLNFTLVLVWVIDSHIIWLSQYLNSIFLDFLMLFYV